MLTPQKETQSWRLGKLGLYLILKCWMLDFSFSFQSIRKDQKWIFIWKDKQNWNLGKLIFRLYLIKKPIDSIEQLVLKFKYFNSNRTPSPARQLFFLFFLFLGEKPGLMVKADGSWPIGRGVRTPAPYAGWK